MDNKSKVAVEKGIELLKLCSQLQTDKDGVNRPEPGVVDKTKTPDQFAKDINESITYMSSLYKLLPMMEQLSKLGRTLESEGKISVDFGEEFDSAALKYVMKEHGIT